MNNTPFSHILKPQNIITNIDAIQPFLTEWRNRFHGKTPYILLPETTEEVSNIVKTASMENIPLIPQGGNTGLVGGQIPDVSGKEVIISLQKMNNIKDFSPENATITVESGVILETIHQYLAGHNFIFPLHLASEGSAQIGGLISTNAGGTAVLKYGNMRDLILGIEAVLPNGDIVGDLHHLRKANRGFDIKSLFCGTEGIFGIVTAASLKLSPRPKTVSTFLAACNNIHDTIKAYSVLKDCFADQLTECELIPKIGFEFVVNHKKVKCPFNIIPEWGVLFEISSNYPEYLINNYIEETLSNLIDNHVISDCILAQSATQALEIKKIRMLMSECQKYEGASIKHDISVPIKYIPDMITEGCDAACKIVPDIRPVPFGHIGDGNLHFNFSQPYQMNKNDFMSFEETLNDAIFDIVHQYDGSFSAEHGIGQLRREQLRKYIPKSNYALQRQLKHLLDPQKIMNPNKLLID